MDRYELALYGTRRPVRDCRGFAKLDEAVALGAQHHGNWEVRDRLTDRTVWCDGLGLVD